MEDLTDDEPDVDLHSWENAEDSDNVILLRQQLATLHQQFNKLQAKVGLTS